jgi:hypothetical protein
MTFRRRVFFCASLRRTRKSYQLRFRLRVGRRKSRCARRNSRICLIPTSCNGRGAQIRTEDPLLPKQKKRIPLNRSQSGACKPFRMKVLVEVCWNAYIFEALKASISTTALEGDLLALSVRRCPIQPERTISEDISRHTRLANHLARARKGWSVNPQPDAVGIAAFRDAR